MELINVKVETKWCVHCGHHYQDHFRDNYKNPKPRLSIYGCGKPQCCNSYCLCGYFEHSYKYVPYKPTPDYSKVPHQYVTSIHCKTCRDIDYERRTLGAAKQPNHCISELAIKFPSSYSGLKPLREIEKINRQTNAIRERANRNRLQIERLRIIGK